MLRLLNNRFRVLPLHSIKDGGCTCGNADCHSPGKHPLTKNGVKDATNTPGTILGWRGRWPDSNTGVATGRGLVVLDIDPRNGGDESLAELIEKYGPLPETVTVSTGGGGGLSDPHLCAAREADARLGPARGTGHRGGPHPAGALSCRTLRRRRQLGGEVLVEDG